MIIKFNDKYIFNDWIQNLAESPHRFKFLRKVEGHSISCIGFRVDSIKGYYLSYDMDDGYDSTIDYILVEYRKFYPACYYDIFRYSSLEQEKLKLDNFLIRLAKLQVFI